MDLAAVRNFKICELIEIPRFNYITSQQSLLLLNASQQPMKSTGASIRQLGNCNVIISITLKP